MEKLQKIVKHPAFWGSAGILAGAGVAVLVLFLVLFNPMKAENKAYVQQIGTLQAELTDTQDKLVAMGTDVTAKQKELQKINAEMALAKKNISEKQTEIDGIAAEMVKNKQELNQSQKQLDKAKKGVKQLEQLDGLFASYDSDLRKLDEELIIYLDAVEQGDYVLARNEQELCNNLSYKINRTYEEISTLLDNFRNGNY